MKAFICKILHSDIAYAGGKFVRCRTCRREWIAVHHVEPPRAMVGQLEIEEGAMPEGVRNL